MEIRDRVVLVTGASSGIGLATVRRFAQAGARLALAAHNRERLEQVAEELRAKGTEAQVIFVDLAEIGQAAHAVDETVRQYGRLDILINNAGRGVFGAIADVNLPSVQQIFAINVLAPLEAIKAAIPVMRAQGGGEIINISSVISKRHLPDLAALAATKAALNLIADTARVELAPDNIRLITVFPRPTATAFGKHALADTTEHSKEPAGAVQEDTPEFVAEGIFQAALKEPKEQYMDRLAA